MVLEKLREDLARKEEKLALCERLGYRNSAPCMQKIELLLKEGFYGFIKSSKGYDFHMSSEEFLEKLHEIYALDPSEWQEAKKRYEKYLHQFSSYIFVDTGFKRTSEPIFALAMMEAKRHIKIDKELLIDKDLNEQIEKVSQIVRNHYTENRGRLKLWGEIKRYLFFYDEGKNIVFNPQGEVVDEEYALSKATLKPNIAQLFE